jgi:hypothetical protein
VVVTPVAVVDTLPPLSGGYAELLGEFPEGERLWRALHGAGLPAPEVTDAFDEDELDGIEDAHLVWSPLRVALQAGATKHEMAAARKHGWALFDTDTVDPTLVLAALRQGARA